MADTKYKVVFNTNGFDPEKMNPLEWETIKSEFMQIYNMFCHGSNMILEKINSTWKQYEEIKNYGDIASIFSIEMAMGILDKPNYTYYDWVEKWYKEICDSVNEGVGLLTRLTGYIFRDGDMPAFGAKFKFHPDRTMNFTIECC